jgi:hypothetical protein
MEAVAGKEAAYEIRIEVRTVVRTKGVGRFHV